MQQRAQYSHEQQQQQREHEYEEQEEESVEIEALEYELEDEKVVENHTAIDEEEEQEVDVDDDDDGDEEADEEDDLCSIGSIGTQHSFFFHPKNYYSATRKHGNGRSLHSIHSHSHSQSKLYATTPTSNTRRSTTMMSVTSAAATIDELEMLPNMDELHNYDKQKQLGTGTDAHVYEVVDRRDKSHVAMKLTKRKSGRYRTEIHLLHQLRTCPYIVKLLKVLEDSSVYVLILEQAPMTLENLLHERCTDTPMQERVAREIMHSVLKGIRAIHALGFVHKDIKPENVLIFADRIHRRLQAKIADFGFATRAQPPNDILSSNIPIPKQTLSEFVERVADRCGTPGFWAPELVASVVELEHAFKMDVFSAGVTLYRMVCNELCFGLYESWEMKQDSKLAKLKPNFQVVCWIQTTPHHSKNGNANTNANGTTDKKQRIEYIRKLASHSLSKNVLGLLRGMLRIRPHKRLSVGDCLKSEWFDDM